MEPAETPNDTTTTSNSTNTTTTSDATPSGVDLVDSNEELPLSESPGTPFSFHHDVRRSFSFTSLSPVPSKHAARINPLILNYGTASIQGARKTQEDAHITVPDLERPPLEKGKKDIADLPFAFFGIYDGHGGDKASEYICENLHLRFVEGLQKYEKVECNDAENMSIYQVGDTLRNAILKVEEDWMNGCEKTKDCSGSTIAAVVIKDNDMVVANVGDSEVVLCGEGGKAITMTEIHNPKRNAAEGERVKADGGSLYRDRVSHPVLNPMVMSIAVSRAIGDYGFKAPEFTNSKPSGLIADPYINNITLKPHKHRFCIIACDGLWDVFSPQEAVDYVSDKLKETKDTNAVTKDLVDAAYTKGSLDNISASVVFFDWSEAMDTAEDAVEDIDDDDAVLNGSRSSSSSSTPPSQVQQQQPDVGTEKVSEEDGGVKSTED